jgi:hypothetical protein
LPAELMTGVKLSEKILTPVEGWNMTFHIGWIVLSLLLIGLLTWWYIASQKEDKEEESL